MFQENLWSVALQVQTYNWLALCWSCMKIIQTFFFHWMNLFYLIIEFMSQAFAEKHKNLLYILR